LGESGQRSTVLELREPAQHAVYFGSLALNIFIMQALDPPVRRPANAREAIVLLVAGREDLVIFVPEIAEVGTEIHEALVR
jgi:hypothetical protein